MKTDLHLNFEPIEVWLVAEDGAVEVRTRLRKRDNILGRNDLPSVNP